jgi:glutathione synthase/RimK-type ligase-like ATP-grasp enzyme
VKRILLTEGTSLTARETITSLRASGYEIDILSSDRLPLSAFSRWKHRIIPTVNPNEDPEQYLGHISNLLRSGNYVAVVPTHEQAWLLAEGRKLLPPNPPIALAPTSAFRQVQGKSSFASLADKLGIPVPRWEKVNKGASIGISYPYWLKSDFGTAGRSVCKVRSDEEKGKAFLLLSPDNGQLMAQEHISGHYGQVEAAFAQGKMIAAHTTMSRAVGAGGSAAARLSVDDPETREHIERIGGHLDWNGCLTLDFIRSNNKLYYIECNPRMIEPANAAESGVNFAEILIEMSSGQPLPAHVRVGKAGVKTHSIMALLLGAAEQTGSRKALARVLREYMTSSGLFENSTEVLTPIGQDPSSLVPLVATAFGLLINPQRSEKTVAKAVEHYRIQPETIRAVRELADKARQ